MEYSINTDKTHEASPEATNKCEICDINYENKTIFDMHIRSTHRVYACDRCKYKNKAFSSVTEHVKKDHPQLLTSSATSEASTRAKYQCKICNKYGYKTEKTLAMHIKKYHTEYACDNCKYASKEFSLLTEHVKKNCCQTLTSTGVPVEASIKTEHHCRICDFVYKHKDTLKLHIEKIHIKYACDKCKYTNKALTSVTDHVKKDHPQFSTSTGATGKTSTRAKYHCKICNKNGYENKRSLSLHIQKYHTKYACNKCKYTSNSFYRLTEHVIRNRSNLPTSTDEDSTKALYQCKVCGKICNIKKFLRMHYDECHKKNNKFECIKCEYRSEDVTRLENHMKVHPDTSIFCAACKKFFFTLYEYKMHKKRHKDPSESDKFKCFKCNKKYKVFSCLQAHCSRIHVWSSKCNVCGRKFRILKKLEEHKKHHET